MLQVKNIDNKKIWEDFVFSSPQGNFLQSWNWGEFHQRLGNKIFRLGLYQNSKLKGLALLIKIKARRATYFECPGGPLLSWESQKTVGFIFREIQQLAKKERAVFVRIRPNVIKTQAVLQLIKAEGFIKAPMHLHAETTWVLDLDKSPEELLKNMRKNTRYSIKKAIKLGVKTSQSVNEADLKTLYRLQLEASHRHHFVPFSRKYLLQQFRVFQEDNQIQLFKAEYKHQILAASFIIFYGQEAVYHYAGSSDKVKQVPASYALQWQAILEAKKRGLKRYNFWGIAPTDDPKHRFHGVTVFKQGFGGRRIDYLPTHDLVIKPSYWFSYLLETFRKKLRHL